MGQKGLIGRYPFHFHVMGDQIGRGHFVKECSFHDGYQVSPCLYIFVSGLLFSSALVLASFSTMLCSHLLHSVASLFMVLPECSFKTTLGSMYQGTVSSWKR